MSTLIPLPTEGESGVDGISIDWNNVWILAVSCGGFRDYYAQYTFLEFVNGSRRYGRNKITTGRRYENSYTECPYHSYIKMNGDHGVDLKNEGDYTVYYYEPYAGSLAPGAERYFGDAYPSGYVVIFSNQRIFG